MSKPEEPPADPEGERGKRATFDRRTGEVSGSGSSIANPASGEEHDDDLGRGSGGRTRGSDPSNGA